MNVAMVDLLTQTPFYDRYLSQALAPLVECFTLYAIRFHLEPEYFDNVEFRRSPGMIDCVSGLRLKTRPLRQAGKMIEYGLNWGYLLTRFRRRPPDIVHIQWLPLLSRTGWELRAVERIRRSSIPVVYTVHNFLPHEERPDHHQLYRRAYGSVDHLVVHTHTDRERLIGDFGVPPQRISVIAQGPVMGEQATHSREQARRALDLPSTDTVFLMLGVIRPYKGIEEAVRALAEVIQTHPRCRLVVVGQALDQAYLRRVQALASELGVQRQVQWLTRYVHSSEVGVFHAAADAVLFPYSDISQSGAFLTAAALGSCTLTTRVGGLAEIIQDGETGVQIESSAPATLAAGLRRLLLLSPQERASMGCALRLHVKDQCDWRAIAQRTVEAYQRLLALGRSSAGTRILEPETRRNLS